MYQRRRRHCHGTEHVVHVVPVDPVPGGRLDLATDQLVLPEGCNQGIPVTRSVERRTTSMPGAAALARCRSVHCLPIGALLLRRGHPSNAGTGLDTLLELVVDLNHGVPDLIDLVALPGDRQKYLAKRDSEPSTPWGSPFGTARETPQP